MSEVDEVHTHQVSLGNEGPVDCVVPGPIRHCDDKQCAFDRKVIEQFAGWPRVFLHEHINRFQAEINHHLELITQMKEGLRLKDERLDMTADLTARITEILGAHQRHLTGLDGVLECSCDESSGSGDDHDEHVAALIAEAAEQHYRPKVSLLACPHNTPNFGPPCPICDGAGE